ncbi:helix-turn-helix domain-containing protein [Salmonella enterica]|nr:helix-turn-helix domain-containing protein [Salmonella enterica]
MRKRLIADILRWIEEHLEEGINAASVEKISGYTRRHLLTLFVQHTGFSPGQYIRSRRLSRSAFLLRLTNKKIIDIAYQLKFDSQQSFCREFRKFFGCTPRQYRKASDWDFTKLKLPLVLDDLPIPAYEFCEMNSQFFSGFRLVSERKFNEKEQLVNSERYKNIILSLKINKASVYVNTRFYASEERLSNLTINQFIGVVDSAQYSEANPMLEKFHSEGGEYLKVTFEGGWEEYAGLSKRIYHYLLPQLELKRREGGDIEIFHYDDLKDPGEFVRCEYYIPVTAMS